MTATSLLYPVFVQVLLTFTVIILMARARGQSLRESRTSLEKREVALGEHKWSDAATLASNNFKNQFELPVLFYAGIAFALILKQADSLLLGLAWAFALTRVVHVMVHLGPNVVRWRGLIYIIGAVCLLAFWITLFVRVLSGVAVI